MGTGWCAGTGTGRSRSSRRASWWDATGLYYPPDWPGIEVGWTVARDHWGKGYAPEAARAACAWGHDRLGVDHILSLIHPDNAQSIRVAEKLGETLEGRHSTRGFDLLVYGVDLPLDSAN